MEATRHNAKYITLTFALFVLSVYLTSVYLIPKKFNSPNQEEVMNVYYPPFPPHGLPLKAFITSAYYYPHSKSLGNYSFALVMSINLGRTKKNFLDLQEGGALDETEIVVMAVNSTNKIVARAQYERITPHDHCQMISVFATMQLLPNLHSIYMMSGEYRTLIPHKVVPSHQKRDVIVCISPIYVSEQWQNFLLAVHIYKHFGAFMHIYFISAISAFFQLLREYEKSGYLTIQPWDRVIFPFVPGVIADPYSQMEFSNTAAAQTDCILQYKESSKFVALFELNDILIPILAPTFAGEFQALIRNNSNIVHLTYPRQNFGATFFNETETTFEGLANNLKDLGTQQRFGKIVLDPQLINYTWIDRPPYLKNGEELEVTENYITHLQNVVWNYNETEKAPILFNSTIDASDYMNPVIWHIEKDFRRMSRKETIQEIMPNLPRFFHFYGLMKQCFEEKYYRLLNTKHRRSQCPGPQICGFYQHPDLHCVHVNGAHMYMPGVYPITYHYATDFSYTSDIGCYPH
ncbi:unnamed protein product [Caenorhabditis brenneri]